MAIFRYQEQYGIIIICKNEKEQQAIYTRLLSEGYNLKVISV